MPIPDVECTFEPGLSFEPTLMWAWTGSVDHPDFKHVAVTPAVIDINGDGASDVLVSAFDYTPGWPDRGGILCALSGVGDCEGGPEELWCTSPDDPRVSFAAPVAVGDLDGDGELTIVAPASRLGPRGNVYGIDGYDSSGSRLPLFGTDLNGDPVDMLVAVGAPAIADLDGDGAAEVFVGYTVFDSDGRLLWHQDGALGNHTFGPLTVAVDLDGDDSMEIVGGNMAYHADGSPAWDPSADARTLPDGWPAVADFNGDGEPELAVVTAISAGSAMLRIFDREGNLFSSVQGSLAGRGGPPTVADVNGDGTPDVAVAGQNALTVFGVGPAPDHELSIIWQVESRDYSSNFTGSSVFDFDGDGNVEVVYGDECFARVYDHQGNVRFEVPNTSCTATEYPVVADLNADGKAEFVVVANNMLGLGGGCAPYVQACIDNFSGYQPNNGVRVYRDANDNWVSTRAIWNQHSYHVTNVCDGRDDVCPSGSNELGRIPALEEPSWAFPAGEPLNRYRANARLEGLFNAPDLVPLAARADLSGCPYAMILRAQVTNLGAIGVPAGIPVAFYQLEPGPRTLIDVRHTTTVLLPGASQPLSVDWSVPPELATAEVTFEVVVDDDGSGAGMANECDETNNAAEFTGACAAVPQ